ncbi:MAG: restriction endonuclease [Saprospiraceae bacterium]|nr:restriction endonuclease [Saprospiraceae bacterium]
MTSTGKYLEAITSSIEKCSVDNVDKTLIKRNEKLVDRDNVEREVDIYVETIVNRKKLKYAIECKEFTGKTKVEIKHVSDFYDKISNQGIKGIIITTTDFRKNAVKKAKNLNIDVYKIIDNPDPVIKNYQIFQKRHHVNNALIYSTYFTKFDKPDLQYIYVGSNKKRYSSEEFIKGYLIGGIEKYIRQNQEALFSKFIEQNEKRPKIDN